MWKPEGWTWAFALSVKLFIASYLAWYEQFTANQELYGRPDVTLTSSYRDNESPGFTFKDRPGFQLVLNNSGKHTAVNISASSITVAIPDRIRKHWKEQQEGLGGGVAEIKDYPVPVDWIVHFEIIDRLASANNDGMKTLGYWIENIGPMQQCISYVLKEIVGKDLRSQLPLTLVFSNLGQPVRTWHAHYQLEYYLAKGRVLVVRFLSYGEVTKRQETWTYCAP